MSGTGATEAQPIAIGLTNEQLDRAIHAGSEFFHQSRRVSGASIGEAIRLGIWNAMRVTVPEGYVIARAADVLTPEVKAAIGRAEHFGLLCKNIDSLPEDAAHEAERESLYAEARTALSELTDADLARLRAAATGGS